METSCIKQIPLLRLTNKEIQITIPFTSMLTDVVILNTTTILILFQQFQYAVYDQINKKIIAHSSFPENSDFICYTQDYEILMREYKTCKIFIFNLLTSSIKTPYFPILPYSVYNPSIEPNSLIIDLLRSAPHNIFYLNGNLFSFELYLNSQPSYAKLFLYDQKGSVKVISKLNVSAEIRVYTVKENIFCLMPEDVNDSADLPISLVTIENGNATARCFVIQNFPQLTLVGFYKLNENQFGIVGNSINSIEHISFYLQEHDICINFQDKSICARHIIVDQGILNASYSELNVAGSILLLLDTVIRNTITDQIDHKLLIYDPKQSSIIKDTSMCGDILAVSSKYGCTAMYSSPKMKIIQIFEKNKVPMQISMKFVRLLDIKDIQYWLLTKTQVLNTYGEEIAKKILSICSSE